MKYFNRHSVTAFLLSAAMISTSVVPVFAEGSREMATVPTDGTTPTTGTEAMRPYLDWRDRDQFGMPSKNVVNVYAKAGETIFFGSEVTNASDRSIQAIVHKESMYEKGGNIPNSLELEDTSSLKGGSIAVTLPVSGSLTEAYDPEREKGYFTLNVETENEDGTTTTETVTGTGGVTVQEYVESNFLPGSSLTTGADRTKVYLFDVVESGVGHIANPTMEENGPNGITKDGAVVKNGYEPLSFVAPYDGTYSFRFLSREYSNRDSMITPTMNPESRAVKVIDFDGLGESGDEYPTASDSEFSESISYYEESYGDWIDIKAGADVNGTQRGFFIYEKSGNIEIPAASYSAGEQSPINNYLRVANGNNVDAEKNDYVACIEFTPRHDGAEIEIIWECDDTTDTGQRTINVKQGSSSSKIAHPPTDDDVLEVTAITSVGGQAIKAGEPLKIWFSGNAKRAKIYEIRYYHNRMDVGISGAAVPTPTPTPTPAPAETESVALSSVNTSSENDYADQTLSGDVVNATFYSRSYNSNQYGFTNNNDGSITCTVGTYNTNRTDRMGAVIALTPQLSGTSEIAITWNGTGNRSQLYYRNGISGSATTLGSAGTDEQTATINGLSEDDTIYIYFQNAGGTITDITCTTTESATTSEVMSLFGNSAEVATLSETSPTWTASGSTTVTEADGVYTVTQPSGEAAAPVYCNLLDIMENAPADITTAEGTITVSYDLYRPSAYPGSSNWFIDISTNTAVNGWGGGNAGTFGRLTGYGPWSSDFKLVPGTGATNGTTYAFGSAQDDTWNTVTFTINLSAKTVKAAMGDDSSSALTDSYPTGLADALYLNVEPCDSATDNDVVLQFRNITASYSDDAPTDTTTDETLTPVSNAYTWDFYYMTGVDGITQYESDMLVGDFPNADDGTDYDGSYVYDMKVHATAEKPMLINNSSIFLYHPGVFSGDLPESGVLEFIPYWSGTVSATFSAGSVSIKQGSNVSSETSVDQAMTGVSLEVEAGVPVYIYSTSSAWLIGVKYVPDEATTLARGVDEKWAMTVSDVAAWDITVAQGGGQTIAGNTYTWDMPIDFSTNTTKAGLTWSGDTPAISPTETTTYNGETVCGLKHGAYYSSGSNTKNYYTYTPTASGTLKICAYTNQQMANNPALCIMQGENTLLNTLYADRYKMQEFVIEDVAAGTDLKIYSVNGSVFLYTMEFIEDDQTPTDYSEVTGRVWTNIFFLNAGGYKASIYPKLNILTENGFLYDFWMNGTQPYSFVFYSNNRGFLLDRWSLQSNPSLTGTEGTTAALQSLEHSFYSLGDSDVGDAPIRTESDSNGPIEYNGNTMVSPILGNYIPTDDAKDSTHMMFLNSPDQASFEAYTTSKGLRTISSNNTLYADILKHMTYEGLGRGAYGNFGTKGIGGEFHVTITADMAARLKNLGSNSIAVVLDFSAYDLAYEGTAPVPVLDSTGAWAKTAATGASALEGEANNLVTLSMVVNTEATTDTVYTLSWNGCDAYGNIVPEGVYSDIITSVIEMGTAHFPILDAEHNPNGFKVRMINPGNSTPDYLYYNNDAVSPKTNSADPSAWYFTGRDSTPEEYPARIGDGENRTAGISTDAGNTTVGVMAYGEYSVPPETDDTALQSVYDGLNKGQAGGDGGYGNYAAIDMWSRYKVDTESTMTIGVATVTDLKPYVSFVAPDGTIANGTLPFKISHVGYAGEMLEEYPENLGDAESDSETAQKFGNTISTGFITTVSSVAGVTNDYIAWDITIPVSGTKTDDSGNEITMSTYIKIPESATLTTQEDVDEAEYLTYELYSTLFDDYTATDKEVAVGDEDMPDWEADASLDESSDVDIMDTPTSAEDSMDGISEESYIESISMLSETTGTAGDYDNEAKWSVTMNVDSTAVLADTESKVNAGSIYKVNTIGGSADGKAMISLQYKLPTTVSGTGTVKLGIVIDNLYAPGASAIAKYNTEYLDAYHDITGILNGTSNAVRATSFSGYESGSNNEYYRGSSEASVNYVMDFSRQNSTYTKTTDGDNNTVYSVTVGETKFTSSDSFANYSLFGGGVVLNNAKYHNDHGITTTGTIELSVPGAADITIGTCSYGNVKAVLKNTDGTVVAEQEIIGSRVSGAGGTYGCYSIGEDNSTVVFSYSGLPTTLTLSFEASSAGGPVLYLPYLSVVSK